jgi:hypothetical protein
MHCDSHRDGVERLYPLKCQQGLSSDAQAAGPLPHSKEESGQFKQSRPETTRPG